MDLRFAECTMWFAEFADIVYDIDHGCLTLTMMSASRRIPIVKADNLTIVLAAPA